MNKLRMVIMLALLTSLAACSLSGPTQEPTIDIAPTLDAARTQAALTVEAEIASRATDTPEPTATLAATATPVPTNTLPPTLTSLPPTNTYIPLPTQPLYTSTPTLSPTPTDYNCTVVSTSPARNTEFSANADFDAKWNIKNTGSQNWPDKEIDYKYVSGQTMQKDTSVTAYDLAALSSGDSRDIIIDMTAPSSAGTYSTTWAVVRGSRTLCSLSITIVVK